MSAPRPWASAVAVVLGATLCTVASPGAAQRMARPFRCDGCISNYYYFDHDPGGGTEDWRCRGSTYNGHQGADFSLSGGIGAIGGGYAVRAAADGEVIYAVDGNYDRCSIGSIAECSSGTRCTFGTANYVVIRHENRTTRYVHLRNGSVRVARGDRVTCGQVIGQIASSGCSTNAHLHFEVRPRSDADRPYDPFRGECSPRTTSAWIEQGGYRGYPGLECSSATEPEEDAGASDEDAGASDEDAGAGVSDADAGASDVDAGASDEDASVVPSDAASRPTDAGAPGLDAGPEVRDAGAGCGCRAGGSERAPLAIALLVPLTAWLIRARRRSPRC